MNGRVPEGIGEERDYGTQIQRPLKVAAEVGKEGMWGESLHWPKH